MASGVRMSVPHIECRVRLYLKDLPREKVSQLEPFDGVVIDKDNLDEPGRTARENLQELFVKHVTSPSGTNTAKEIQLNEVVVLGLKEYKELLK